MSRQSFPYAVGDISALARSLGAQLTGHDGQPGHLELMNMLARAAGFRNFQHFRASLAAEQRMATPPPPPPEAVDHTRIERLLRYFDGEGKLARWPGKDSHRETCLWVLWSRIPPRTSYIESEINRVMTANHQFGDHALLRRELVDRGMMRRTADGGDYRRIERQPPAEAIALIRRLAERT